MPDQAPGFWEWLGIVVTGVFAVIVGWLSYYSRSNFVTKKEFIEHCRDTQHGCRSLVCNKIGNLEDRMERFEKNMGEKTEKIEKSVITLTEKFDNTNTSLSTLIGAFNQYIEDQNKEEK